MADYKHIVPFIKKKEGGLSRATTDTASSYPCPVMYKGYYGWHTNKGITWETFEANIGHYPDRFFNMSDSDWMFIYKKKYWDKFDLDNIKNQALANIIVTWAWGSGVGATAYNFAKFINQTYGSNYPTYYHSTYSADAVKFVDTFFNGAIFLELCDERARQFKSYNQPQNLQGWLNRLNDFKKFHEGMFGLSILPFLGVLLLLFYFWK